MNIWCWISVVYAINLTTTSVQNMGIIDSTKHTLTCPKCGVVEQASVHQKGSRFGATWQQGPEFHNFEVVWVHDDFEEPQLKQAKCRQCGVDASALMA